MARNRWVRSFAALIAIAAFAAGCGGDDGGTESAVEPEPQATAEPTTGGEATFLFSSEARTLDSIATNGYAAENGHRLFAIYGALVVLDPDTGEIVPVLAESFSPSDDFRTWTLRLRPDLVFSDGTPFDAEAVRFNWQRAADPAAQSPAQRLASSVSSMEVVDERTLTIHLSAPNAHLDRATLRSSLTYIGSPTAIQSGHDMAGDPIGAGPFMVDSWVRDDRLILVRNPKWFDAPRPYLDRLTIRVVTDEQQRVDTFLTGDADLMWSPTAGIHEEVAASGKGTSELLTIGGGVGLLFNVTKPPFDDVRLREVFAMALDREILADLARPGTPAANNLTVPDTPWASDAGELPALDATAAQELLDEIVAERGPLSISLLVSNTGTGPQAMKYVQTAFDQLEGLKIELDVVDVPTMSQRVRQGDFVVVQYGWPFVDPEPTMYDLLHSKASGNFMGYRNAAVDEALDAGRAEAETAKRAELYETMWKTIADELPILPYVNSVQGIAYTDSVHDVTLYQDGVLRSDLVWIE